MKTEFKITYPFITSLIVVLSTFMVSCTNEEYELSKQAASSQIVCFESGLTESDMDSVTDEISNAIDFSTRSIGNELTEDEAMHILKPLANDGKNLQKQILYKKNELALSPDEVILVKGMTNDQLAEMSYAFNTIWDSGMTSQKIKGEDVVGCLLYATGIQSLSDLARNGFEITSATNLYKGTKMLMTAKTARQIITAFAKRAMGWVGVAWMVYDFSKCMKDKNNG